MNFFSMRATCPVHLIPIGPTSQYLVNSADYEAPHLVLFSVPKLALRAKDQVHAQRKQRPLNVIFKKYDPEVREFDGLSYYSRLNLHDGSGMFLRDVKSTQPYKH
ncbi:hypothetical protein L798_15475 [Zootermopsis nevadensis]|uniref:Uncharacterized protein n=1 Tax=Zootermopsis nevadensis TaxID=136037 RepID=A0A067QWP4_ZOONE|nr:hypothetical protein L798_15475 [Zootermopsis nevadensis]